MSSTDNKEPSIAAGLDALFNFSVDTKVASNKDASFNEIFINRIRPCASQPRRYFNENELNELANSIKLHGILQPIVVRPVDNNFYELIAGERRWRAAQLILLEKIPCIIKEASDDLVFAFSLIENIQRANLTVIEEAKAYQKLYQHFQLTHEQVGSKVAKSRSYITNLIRLLDLCEEVINLVESGQLTMGHARTLLTLDREHQISLAEKIIKNDLSVRETEQLIKKMKNPKPQSLIDPHAKEIYHKEKCEYWSNMLSTKFSSKVSVKLNEKGQGKIIIHLDSSDEIDWLVDHVKIESN